MGVGKYWEISTRNLVSDEDSQKILSLGVWTLIICEDIPQRTDETLSSELGALQKCWGHSVLRVRVTLTSRP